MKKLAKCLRRDWKSSNCWSSFCAKCLIGGSRGSSGCWRKQLTAQNIGEMIWNGKNEVDLDCFGPWFVLVGWSVARVWVALLSVGRGSVGWIGRGVDCLVCKFMVCVVRSLNCGRPIWR